MTGGSAAGAQATVRRPRSAMRWVIVSIAGLMSLLAGIDKANISILAKPLIATHLVTAQTIGLSNSLFLIVFAVANALSGLFVDRFGSKRLLAMASAWWGVVTALTAVFWAGFALVPMRVLLGIGEGFQGSTGGKWVKEWFPTRERAMAGTIQNTGLWVGGIVTGPLVTWLFLSTHSVVTPWLVMGIGTLVLAVPAVIFLGADKPEQHRLASEEEVQFIRSGQGIERPNEMTTREIFSSYRYWIVIFTWSGMATIFYGLTFWFPLYMEDVRHVPVRAAGLWYAVPYILMALFAVGASLLSDRVVRRAPFYAIGTLMAGILLFVATRMGSVTPALLVISLGLAFNGFVVPNITATLQQIAQTSNMATVYGISIALENFFSAIGIYIIGISFNVGFIYMEAFSILGGLAAFLLVARGM